MNTYFYAEDDEDVIEQLDNEFMVVVRVGMPDDGYNDSHDLAIYDPRSKDEIAKAIRQVYNTVERKA